MRHMEIRQVRDYSIQDVVGDIGGYLGLFLGFSFFDVISKCLQKFFELVSHNH